MEKSFNKSSLNKQSVIIIFFVLIVAIGVFSLPFVTINGNSIKDIFNYLFKTKSVSVNQVNFANNSDFHKIKHVIIIVQENRAFDHYFGTYPGADGIPMKNGIPSVCLPDPFTGLCIRPFHDTSVINDGGSHDQPAAMNDMNNGKMDGFVIQARNTTLNLMRTCRYDQNNLSLKLLCRRVQSINNGMIVNASLYNLTRNEICACFPDAMGYHDRNEIPNYWAYADNFVLQDHMFEPIASWSLPSHLFLVSAWSAKCNTTDPMSCVNEPQSPNSLTQINFGNVNNSELNYAWTDLTYLLHKYNVSWTYYLDGTEIECDHDDGDDCNYSKGGVPSIWNPLAGFNTVKENKQMDHIKSLSNFSSDLENHTLPQVAWITPSLLHSEHNPATITMGQAYVTRIVNLIMNSSEWNNTAIFITWDDWGGFYDHVAPLSVDINGYGIRVPGLLISPYAKKGYIDKQTLSFDAYLKFVEDIFMNGERIDPATDGRPDPRPSVRENAVILGDLRNEFNFSQSPLPPLILNPRPSGVLD